MPSYWSHLAGLMQLQLLNRTSTQAGKIARLTAKGARSFRFKQHATEMAFGGGVRAAIVLGVGLSLVMGMR